MADLRLSNVIGAPFPEHVLTQLNIRAAHNSTGTGAVPTRSPDEVLFLANKMGWVKLTSSVRVITDKNQTLTQYYNKLSLDGTVYKTPEDLAKNWILQAGTSQVDGAGIGLRSGLGPNGSYGLGGTVEQGYRPMPGLTSVTIDTLGTLGSLRQATISFKVWNMQQLNIIEALYFRLGYSMILEWGHVQYFNNVAQNGNLGGTFQRNAFGLDAFSQNMRKEQIQQVIAKKGKDSGGNYDGMFGIVTNFNWSFNQDGGYDCTVRLTGLGSIIDTLRINQSYKMPDVIFQAYTQQQEDQKTKEAQITAQKKQDEEAKYAAAHPPPVSPVPTDIETLWQFAQEKDNYKGTLDAFKEENAYYPAYVFDPNNINAVPDYFYLSTASDSTDKADYNKKVVGLFLQKGGASWISLHDKATTPFTLNAELIEGFIQRYLIDQPAKYKDGVLSANTVKTENRLTKLLDFTIASNQAIVSGGTAAGSGKTISTSKEALDILPNKSGVGVRQDASIIEPGYGTKTFSLDVSYECNDSFYRPTKKQALIAFNNWYAGTKPEISLVSMVGKSNLIHSQKREVIVTGKTAGLLIHDVLYLGTSETVKRDTPKKDVYVYFTFTFNDTAFINIVGVAPNIGEPIPTPPQAAATGDVAGDTNGAASQQVNPAQQFESALHAMLSATKSLIQSNTPTDPNKGVFDVSLLELTNQFYQDGILKGIADEKPASPTSFDVLQYALKGFNSNLMSDPALFDRISTVDFKKLCTGYGIRYAVNEDPSQVHYPTYIKFGYLMAFLNSMCLIYDSTQDTNKHPYVYLDFNPETNYCLTTPSHLSIDPMVCMIPFQGTQEDYFKIFPPEIAKSITDPFGPDKNAVSSYIASFKTPDNRYQGRTMEILLNIDFLFNTLQQYTTNDANHIVNLKGFLDAIVTGINKSTGALNMFRVAYRDDSNTVIIKDDQFVPPNPSEAYMLDRAKYLSAGGQGGVAKYGQIPVFGLQSLVREMEFKTDLSTKVSSMIAISGQAQTGSVNATDNSPIATYNTNFIDAYKPRVGNATTGTASTKAEIAANQAKKVAQDLDSANQFNVHIMSIYYGQFGFSKNAVSQATNYYIQGISVIKAKDQITTAAPIIPANLSITIDGISGITMGNAFTIPEDRLPMSLQGADGGTKVGFAVVGLTHTIDQNQWLTKIRGQMIRLRDNAQYGAPNAIAQIQTTFPGAATTGPYSGLTGQAVTDAVNFIKSQEGLYSAKPGGYVLVSNPTPTTIVYAYKDSGGVPTIGWGTTLYRTGVKQGNKVTMQDAITVAEADSEIRAEVAYVNLFISNNLKPAKPLTNGQLVALLSLGYNAGVGGLQSSPMWQGLQSGASTTTLAQQFAIYRATINGVTSKGLLNRRQKESQIFLS